MRLVLFITILFYSLSVFSQDKCAPIGWALYDGIVTGGGSAIPITVNTIEELISEAGASASKPKVIYIAGKTMGNGEAIRIRSNKTIIGMPGATIKGNIETHSDTNIIVRNLILQGPGASDNGGDPDVLNLTGGHRIWIDHCDFRDGYDGNFDIKSAANYISVTWCKFSYGPLSANHGHRLSNLIGSNDNDIDDRGKLKVTFQYNWWSENIVERMPRVRFGQVHVVNNLFTSEGSSYCVRGAFEADVLVEANAFIHVAHPVDIYNDNAKVTFKDNMTVGCTGSSYGDAFTPPYTLDVIPANQVRALVSDPNFGAGATLTSPTECGTVGDLKYKIYSTADNGLILPNINDSLLASGVSITLLAKPNEGYQFDGWEGDVNSSDTTIELRMDGDKILTAKFVQKENSVHSLKSNLLPCYPNPVKDELSIGNFDSIERVEIFNSLGKMVFQSIIHTSSLDVSSLKSGVYVVCIHANSKEFKTKFMKE